jgi:hypothetical protein
VALPADLLGTELAMATWETLPAGPVDGRFESSVIWTGREVIVWGGEQGPDGPPQSTGAAYDPVAGAWRTIVDAPIAPRSAHAAVWTGTEMVVWGGGEGGHHPADAGAYDPAADSWRVIPPSPIRSVGSATAVWNGSEVLIWGGFLEGIFPVVDGAAFDPCANTWRELPAFPLAEGRLHPLAAWTGNEAIIWGGTRTNNVPWEDGAAFDPATNTWRLLPLVDIFGFFEPTGGWTGTELIVWGWSNLVIGRAEHNQTVAFDPVGDTWRHLAPAPLVPVAHEVAGTGARAAAVWAGDQLLAWTASLDAEGPLVLSLDPSSNHWTRLPRPPEVGLTLTGEPVWTGAELFVPGAGPEHRSLLLRLRQRSAIPTPRLTG